ncbi:tripartite tricarboxylate transporter substrate-binding protein [Comamonas endophytica]|uniref:tripartite tricarboxylate transporter substrate-binding protein n=1 Tax=Comamonas endophytica TaxID=2949090 RepID=UPI0036109DED
MPKYLAWCKANPRSASFGSGATGTKIHFAGVRLGQLAGVKLEHVGYSNAGAAMTDLVGANLPAYVGSVPTVIPFAQKIRILATTGSQRSRFLPDVPTLSEAGYKELAFDESMGLYLPRGTAQETVELLYRSMAEAMRSPAVAETLAVAGIEVRVGSGAELAQQIRAESAFWGGIVKSLGFKQDS